MPMYPSGMHRLSESMRGTTAGVAPVPIVETTPLYSDDFNSYTDGTIVVGGLGWTAISSVGATTGEKFNPAVIGGAVTQRSSGSILDTTTTGSSTNSGKYLLTPPAQYDLGSPNQWAAMTIKTFVGGPAISLAATDEVTRVSALVGTNSYSHLTRGGAGVAPVTSASATSSGTARMNSNDAAAVGSSRSRVWAIGDVMIFSNFHGKGYVQRAANGLRHGAPMSPNAGISTTGITGTKFGISSYQYQYLSIDKLEAGRLAGVLFIDAPRKSYPRVQGLGGYANGAANVTFTGTFDWDSSCPVTGAPSGVAKPTGMHWALFDPETGAQVTAWAWVAAPTITITATSGVYNSGTFSAPVVAPCGANGVRPYRMGLRFADDTKVANQNNYNDIFTVAYTVLIIGQSNGAYYNQGFLTADIPYHGGGHAVVPQTTSPFTDNQWDVVAGSALTVTGLNSHASITYPLSQALGLPVFCINTCYAGVNSPVLGPGGADWAAIQATIAANGNCFDEIWLIHGEAGLNDYTGTEASIWKAQWRDVNLPAYRALNTGQATTNVPIFSVISGKYVGSTASDAVCAALRRAQAELVSEVTNCYMAAHPLGVTLLDGVHYTHDRPGRGKFASRMILSSLKQKGLSTYNGRGPIATGVTRAGATVTVAVDLNGAASIAGSALTGWQVATASSFASPLAITSVDVSGGNVVIVLTADPGTPVYVQQYVGVNPDDSSLAIGTYADGTTIEMEPIVIPLVTPT